jgi:hypothetical protein
VIYQIVKEGPPRVFTQTDSPATFDDNGDPTAVTSYLEARQQTDGVCRAAIAIEAPPQ